MDDDLVRLSWAAGHYCGCVTYKTYSINNKGYYRRSGRGLKDEHTKDHVIPKSIGGRNTVDCCQGCNSAKRDMSKEDFISYKYGFTD